MGASFKSGARGSAGGRGAGQAAGLASPSQQHPSSSGKPSAAAGVKVFILEGSAAFFKQML